MAALAACGAVYLIGRVLAPSFGEDVGAAWRIAAGLAVYLVAKTSLLMTASARPSERLGWTLLAAAPLVYVLGSAANVSVDAGSPSPPLAYVGWLGAYLLIFAGVTALSAPRTESSPRTRGLELAALLSIAGAIALEVAQLADLARDGGAASALNASFPILDAALLVYIGWAARSDRTGSRARWWWCAAAAGLLLVADVWFAVASATSGADPDSLVTSIYPLAFLLLAAAGGAPSGPAPQQTGRRRRTARTALAPVTGIIVLSLLYAAFLNEGANRIAVLLGAAGALLLAARVAVELRELDELRSDRTMAAALDRADVPTAFVQADGALQRSNRALREIFAGAALDGSSIAELVDEPADAQRLRQAVERREPVQQGPLVARRSGGPPRWIEMSGAWVDDAALGEVLFLHVRDATDEVRRRALAALVTEVTSIALVESDHGRLVRRALDSVADAFPDADTVVLLVLRSPAEDVVRRAPDGVRPEQLARQLRLEADAASEREMACSTSRLPGGEAFKLCVAWPDRDPDREEHEAIDEVGRVLTSAAQRIELERTVERQALHDPLTGLANRALLMEHLEHAIAGADRSPRLVTAILIDLDRFKPVNDQHGHQVGDLVLAEVADRLRTATREGDMLARLGGDEFVVVLRSTTRRREADLVAARITRALLRPMDVGGVSCHVGASLGVAVESAGQTTPEGVLRHADLAMYEAKASGGGCYRSYDATLRDQDRRRVADEADLRDDVAAARLTVAWQPHVELASGAVVALEALIRWPRSGGPVAPDGFLHIAEGSGLMRSITDRVIDAVAAAHVELTAMRAEPVRLVINLSASQIVPGLPERFRQLVLERGMPPGTLGIDVPESVIATDASAAEVLAELRDDGVRIAVHDFGAGWASLETLDGAPVDEIRLARPIVAALPGSASSRAFARAAAELGAELGLTVGATGLETPAQISCLQSLGVQLGQGHVFAQARPLGEALAPLLRA